MRLNKVFEHTVYCLTDHWDTAFKAKPPTVCTFVPVIVHIVGKAPFETFWWFNIDVTLTWSCLQALSEKSQQGKSRRLLFSCYAPDSCSASRPFNICCLHAGALRGHHTAAGARSPKKKKTRKSHKHKSTTTAVQAHTQKTHKTQAHALWSPHCCSVLAALIEDLSQALVFLTVTS